MPNGDDATPIHDNKGLARCANTSVCDANIYREALNVCSRPKWRTR